MTRSKVERDKRRLRREQARGRAALSRWALVAERLAPRDISAAYARDIRAAIAIIGVSAGLEEDERIELIEVAQYAVRVVRETLNDADVAELSRGDEVADRARLLAWSDYDQRSAGADMTPAQWAYERRCVVVRTSWVAIASDDGASWVWDADSADTYRRVRELQGDEWADTLARRYLRLPVLGVAREVCDGK